MEVGRQHFSAQDTWMKAIGSKEGRALPEQGEIMNVSDVEGGAGVLEPGVKG